jgi:4,4'-diaponeurosporenoate glycosyltransferase
VDLPLRPILLGLGWLVGWCLLWRARGLPRDGAASADVSPDQVSVVIPARDEADTLPALLDALARQDRPPNEIVVVDDASSDDTARLAAARGARVVSGAARPPGWNGKPWAMWQGANAARSPILVFLDADTRPAPSLLGGLVATAVDAGGLVSVQPYHRMQAWWERGAAFFNVVAVMGVGNAAIRPRVSGAFGPCVACSRSTFLELADHPSIRGAVVEDVALARRFADKGLPVAAFAGRSDLAFRMYRRPHDLVAGFAKNIASGAASTPPLRFLAIVGWVTACLAAIAGLWRGEWVGLVAYAAFALQLTVMLRPLGSFSVTGVVYPAAAVVFVAVFAWSVVLLIRGEVRWKGRTIRLRRGAHQQPDHQG